MVANAFDFSVPAEQGYGFTQAMLVGQTLYISGQLAFDEQGELVGIDDFELQMRTSFANLDRVLAHYNANRSQIVQTSVYVVNLREHIADVRRLHAEYVGPHRPTSTLLGVSDLALSGQLVEIGALAVLTR